MSKNPPAATPAVSNETYGAVAAAVDFCARVDKNGGKAEYRQAARKLLAGSSEDDFEMARKTREFDAAYEVINRVFGTLSRDDALSLCRAAL
ncbi:MAG: hypothetical protein ACRETU_07450 [Steroidobacterales bacterium]